MTSPFGRFEGTVKAKVCSSSFHRCFDVGSYLVTREDTERRAVVDGEADFEGATPGIAAVRILCVCRSREQA